MNYQDLTIHPFADLFPLLKGDEFAALVTSIKENGLNEPVWLSVDKTTLIEGRNRGRACEAAKAELKWRTIPAEWGEEQIREFVIDENVKRRQLSPSQRASIASKIEKVYFEENKENRRQHGGSEPGRRGGGRKLSDRPDLADPKTTQSSNGNWSAVKAAKDAGASATGVKDFKRIERLDPELATAIHDGDITINAALEQVREQERRRKKVRAATQKEEKTSTIIFLKTHEGQEVPYPQPKSKATFNRTNEQVAWASWTWNPVTGCLHGCTYCYAREISQNNEYYPVGFTPLFHHERLDAPANMTVPDSTATNPPDGRVFVCSMADLYGKWVPDDWIEQVHASCRANPQWEYLFLTKFPSRYTKLENLPETAWIGTTVDTQRRVAIAEGAFREISNVRAKWLSLEPLLEPLQFKDLSMFDFVVIGAQSSTEQPDEGFVPEIAPPFEWVARIWHQAKEAGCQVFLKPNLMPDGDGTKPGMLLPEEVPILHDVKRRVIRKRA